VGSSCGVNTTFNALVPGVVNNSSATVWEVVSVPINDSGTDGSAGNGGDDLQAFAVGIFP
jgi:hypothetical protein